MTEDTEIMVAVEVVEDMLGLVSPDKRLAVLTVAVAREEAARKRREAGPRVLTLTEFMQQPDQSAGWSEIVRLKSLVIEAFTRSIANAAIVEGLRVGPLVVIGRAGHQGGQTRWRCRCDCGTEKIVSENSLKRGYPKSCTCSTRPARPAA